MNPKVDFFFDKATKWHDEQRLLRSIVLDCQLKEELKWGVPCYTYQDKNIILIHSFKEYFAVLFVKGALLKDPKGILIQQTENVQSARQVRFTSVADIEAVQETLKQYIFEAVEIEESGAKVALKKTDDYAVPEEFQEQLDNNAALKEAFAALTPGRQRAYLFYFGQAKQSKTRVSRVEKYIPQIMEGKGLDD